MPTTQIKPFGVFNGTGSKTTSQSANNASSFLGCVGCMPQQPASVSTSSPIPMKGFGGAAIMRPM